ncbi:MAG: hypothetical protein GC192_18445 [Bacteroidetes bacterium]|nr:hypothetical protein [Bacteroidota bacterium]
MKARSTTLFILIFCFANAFCQVTERCATVHEIAGKKRGNVRFQSKVERLGLEERMVINIPVVVHVVWSKAEENISTEQIQSQLKVLNEDFNAGNVQISSVPVIFQALVADVGFQFCLASKDPNGQATNGIVRIQTANTIGIGGTTAIHHTSQGGSDAWDPSKYLNIWVSKFAGNLGGVGSFPGEGPEDEQGVEVNYKQFGTIGTATNPPYNLGRTCTHEIGHYFNLEHVWGPNANSCCTEDDGVADTPVSCEDYLDECPSGNTFSCFAPDMWMNFMNYTNDACMAMFSKGQKERMIAALNDFRAGLLESDGCQSVATNEPIFEPSLKVYGNPVDNQLVFEIKSSMTGKWDVKLVNLLGQPIYTRTALSNTPVILDCAAYGSGVCFLVAKQNQTELVRKLVLN